MLASTSKVHAHALETQTTHARTRARQPDCTRGTHLQHAFACVVGNACAGAPELHGDLVGKSPGPLGWALLQEDGTHSLLHVISGAGSDVEAMGLDKVGGGGRGWSY